MFETDEQSNRAPHRERIWLRPVAALDISGPTARFVVALLLAGLLATSLVSAGPHPPTVVTLTIQTATIQGCETIQTELWINNIPDSPHAGLYGADVLVSFDPDALEVVDIENGEFLTEPFGFTREIIDNDAGTFRYALAQLDNPPGSHPAAHGSGALAVLYLRAKQSGPQTLTFTFWELSDPYGVVIPATPSAGSVTNVAPAAPALSIARLNATTPRLSWSAVAGVDGYHLYREEEPYFTPVPPPYQTIPSSTFYDDTGALGSPATNYYYVVRSACDSGLASANSDRVGEFDFAIVPGSGP